MQVKCSGPSILKRAENLSIENPIKLPGSASVTRFFMTNIPLVKRFRSALRMFKINAYNILFLMKNLKKILKYNVQVNSITDNIDRQNQNHRKILNTYERKLYL